MDSRRVKRCAILNLNIPKYVAFNSSPACSENKAVKSPTLDPFGVADFAGSQFQSNLVRLGCM